MFSVLSSEGIIKMRLTSWKLLKAICQIAKG